MVFEFSPNGTGGYNYTVLHFFTGGSSDGAVPDGGLTMDSAGNLYGTTNSGGASGDGVIFKVVP